MPRVLESKEDGVLDAPRLDDLLTWRGGDLSRASVQLSASKSYTSDALTELTGYELPTELRLTAKFLDWQPFRSASRRSRRADSSSGAGARGADQGRSTGGRGGSADSASGTGDDSAAEGDRARGGSGVGAVKTYLPPTCALSLSTVLSDIGGGERRTKGTLRYKARVDSHTRRWTYGVEADRLLALGDFEATRAFVNVAYMKRPAATDWQVDSVAGVEQVARAGRLQLIGRVGVTPEGDLRTELRDFRWLRAKHARAGKAARPQQKRGGRGSDEGRSRRRFW